MARNLRWGVVAVVGVCVAGFALFGEGFPSIVSTVFNEAREGAKESLSSEFQLKRAAERLEAADGQIEAMRRKTAEAEVAVSDIETEIAGLQQREKTAVAAVARLRDAYAATGNGVRQAAFVGNERTETSDIEKRLAAVVTEVEAVRSLMRLRGELLEARRRAAKSLRELLSRTELTRHRTGLDIEARLADLACIEAASSVTAPSAPALAEAQSLVKAVEQGIKTERRVSELRGDIVADLSEDGTVGSALLERASRLIEQDESASTRPVAGGSKLQPLPAVARLGGR